MDKRYNPNNTETHRQCAVCERVLLRTEYHTSNSTHDGLFPYCKECTARKNAEAYQRNQAKIASRRKALKQECVDTLGGKCSRCGYNEFVSGLDFHHTGVKEGELAQLITKAATGNGKQHEILMTEVSRCILLCRNCHSAFHAGEWS